jgi:hypothetical protein
MMVESTWPFVTDNAFPTFGTTPTLSYPSRVSALAMFLTRTVNRRDLTTTNQPTLANISATWTESTHSEDLLLFSALEAYDEPAHPVRHGLLSLPSANHPQLSQLEAEVLWEYAKLAKVIRRASSKRKAA